MKNIIVIALALLAAPLFAEHTYPANPDPTHAEFFGKLGRDNLVITNVDAKVKSVNGKTGEVVLNASDVGAISSESDPTVPAWAKAATPPKTDLTPATNYTDLVAAGLVPFTEDTAHNKTAIVLGTVGTGQRAGVSSLTIGTLNAAKKFGFCLGTRCTTTSQYGFSAGYSCIAHGNAFAFGWASAARKDYTFGLGYGADSDADGAFVWSGHNDWSESDEPYPDNGEGTFSIYPINGLYGFYIDGENFGNLMDAKADAASVYTKTETDGKLLEYAKTSSVTNIVDARVSANLNTFIDAKTGIEYVGKYWDDNLYYVPTGNVYPPNN